MLPVLFTFGPDREGPALSRGGGRGFQAAGEEQRGQDREPRPKRAAKGRSGTGRSCRRRPRRWTFEGLLKRIPDPGVISGTGSVSEKTSSRPVPRTGLELQSLNGAVVRLNADSGSEILSSARKPASAAAEQRAGFRERSSSRRPGCCSCRLPRSFRRHPRWRRALAARLSDRAASLRLVDRSSGAERRDLDRGNGFPPLRGSPSESTMRPGAEAVFPRLPSSRVSGMTGALVPHLGFSGLDSYGKDPGSRRPEISPLFPRTPVPWLSASETRMVWVPGASRGSENRNCRCRAGPSAPAPSSVAVQPCVHGRAALAHDERGHREGAGLVLQQRLGHDGQHGGIAGIEQDAAARPG